MAFAVLSFAVIAASAINSGRAGNQTPDLLTALEDKNAGVVVSAEITAKEREVEPISGEDISSGVKEKKPAQGELPSQTTTSVAPLGAEEPKFQESSIKPESTPISLPIGEADETPTQREESKDTPKPPAVENEISVTAILSNINQERSANGLSAVVLNNQLNIAAYNKSEHMSENSYFSHSWDGTSDIDFIDSAGYQYQAVGINLAKGTFGSATNLVKAWMDSPGHRANILADFGRDVGIGIVGDYYTMIIGKA